MSWFAAFEVAFGHLGTAERVAVSIGTFLLLGAVFFVARRESARRDSRLWRVLAGFASITALVAASGALAVVWNVETSAWAAVTSLRVQVELLVRVFMTMTFLVVVYVATGVVHRMVGRFMKQHNGITDHQAEVTYRIVQICVYVLALLAVLGFWSVDLSGLLIGAGFAGIVVGMAARQTIGAVIAGFVLMFSRPFEIGDWVKVGDKDGIVTDITIVNTRLQTFDGEYVMLPNDYVGSNEIVNRSRKGRLRIHVEVGVDYGTDVDRARKVAKEAMSDVEDILTVPRPQVVFQEFGDSSVVLDLRFWIDKPSARRMWRAQTAVISAVKSAFDEAGITIPFPQRSLSARDAGGGFQVQQSPATAAPGGQAQGTGPMDDPGRDANRGRADSTTDESRVAHVDHDPPAERNDLESAVEPAGDGNDAARTGGEEGNGDANESTDAADGDSPESAVERVEQKDD
ncbi:mechanosensitive ion channel family protein [Halobacterium zhouii]|uniref:mechanosensitive ion channel family protein n=1 Tax=Halobacterium zhouii TaxID=2902624 RepID=UPI001E5757DE|nr:mechanosensitive ion channel family protein [Halobacterium zhouii]